MATAMLVLVLFARSYAFDAALDPLDIQEALAIGQSRIAHEHDQFHRAYRVTIRKAPVDWLEIVTPFRRIVLAAEAKSAAGDRRFGQRQALDMLASSRDQIDIYVELSFHPLNTFVGVPEYEITMTRADETRTRAPLSIERIPRFGPRVSGAPPPVPTGPVVPGGSQPMLGGTVIAHFDTTGLEPSGVYDVVIREVAEKETRPTSELARARVELAAMR